jgi:L-iditol 2-dehydrogenase
MLEPVNTVLKAVRRLALLRGDVVLVAGQGPIGLMFTRLLQLAGARILATDLLAARLKFARRFGTTWTANPNTRSRVSSERGSNLPPSTQSSTLNDFVHRLTRGRGLDAAVIAVPSDAVAREALALLRGGGQLLLFAHTRRGVPTELDLASVCVDEKDVLGSYSADFTLQAEVARLVFSRRLDVRPLITHRFPLAQTPAAIALASRPTPDSLKIVVSHETCAA